MAPSPCVCGYNCDDIGNYNKHVKCCKVRRGWNLRDELDPASQTEHVETLRGEIRYLREQLSLALKSPRTVTNHHTHNDQRKYIVKQHVVPFGEETVDHITDSDFQRLLGEPETAVSEMVRLKHRPDTNANVRCPNKREPRYLVVEKEGDERVWRFRDKDAVLEKMWQDSGGLLENEADEETRAGARL